MMEEAILRGEKLKKYFSFKKSFLSWQKEVIRAVDGVSFEVGKKEILGLVGESGCGKTTLGRLILRLIEPTEGKILFDGVDVTSLNHRELKKMRRKMQIVYQDPYESLNPRMTIYELLREPIRVHKITMDADEAIEQMLEAVGLTPVENFLRKYPHELSGGQRQRCALARVLVLRPIFIVADEPVSMLDVSIRTGIIELLMKLRKDFDISFLFITHDLAVARHICDRIATMYLGKIIESGFKNEIFDTPLHPYTQALLDAVPEFGLKFKHHRIQKIKDVVTSPTSPIPGCRFHPRCPYAEEICRKEEPQLIEAKKAHFVACHEWDKIRIEF